MALNTATGSKFGGLDVKRIISATTYTLQIIIRHDKKSFLIKKLVLSRSILSLVEA